VYEIINFSMFGFNNICKVCKKSLKDKIESQSALNFKANLLEKISNLEYKLS